MPDHVLGSLLILLILAASIWRVIRRNRKTTS
jgi:hypothetical protein